MQGDLEIGSFAGDMSLYFALIDDPPEVVAQPSITTPAEDCGSPVAGAPSITAFHSLTDFEEERGNLGIVGERKRDRAEERENGESGRCEGE